MTTLFSSTAIVFLSVFVHLTHSNIIQVGNHGNGSIQCCKLGECICSSLFNALQYLDINTVVNITEDFVILDNVTQMGSDNLSNVTIVGNHVTVYCNNTGRVFCDLCSNVTIKGITWDQCGWTDSSTVIAPALHFINISNLVIENCTFRYSSGCQIHLKQTSGQIAIISCDFISNSLAYNPSNYLYASGLYVDNVVQISHFSVVLSRFHDNRCGLFVCSYAAIINSVVFDSSISIKDTEFSANRGGVLLLNTSSSVVKLSNINVYNNSGRGINIIMHKVNNLSDAFINVTSCYFQSNKSPLSF